MGIARATLVGNLTNDGRLNDAGTVLNLRLAVNSRRKEGEEWVDKPNYFDVVVIGNRASGLAGILSKGKQIAVDAKIQWREFIDKDGNNRQSVEFLADEVQLLGKKGDTSDLF